MQYGAVIICSARYGECVSRIENKVVEIFPIRQCSIRNFLGPYGEFYDGLNIVKLVVYVTECLL